MKKMNISFRQLVSVITVIGLTALFTACGDGESKSSGYNTGDTYVDQQTSAPANVALASGSEKGTITVSWDSVTGADSYNIYWGTAIGVTTTNGTLIAGVTSPYDHTGLTTGTDYYYIITAVGAAGESSASGETTLYPYLSPLKTNQLTSYAAGDDGDIQAGRSINFTGPIQHVTYTADYTTTDNVTGLVWKSCSEGKSGATCAGTGTTMTWATATGAGTGCDALNTANAGNGYAGITTWHLPAIQEQETLINYAAFSTPSFYTYFPATIVLGYWSSSPDIANTSNTWSVNFGNIGRTLSTPKTGSLNVRCVAGSYTPAPAYFDKGDGTIVDKSTGLIWQKCSRGQNSDAACSDTATKALWTNALSYCNSLTLAGKTWRLPNENELKSILLDRAVAPVSAAIDDTVFPSTAAGGYWSSTTSAANTGDAWIVDFNTSLADSDGKGASYNVRCVTN